MMLVVTLIGVLAAITVPRYARSFEYLKVKSAAYDIAATMEYAQATSIVEGLPLRVVLDRRGGTCWVTADALYGGSPRVREARCEMPTGVKIDVIEFVDPFAGGRSYVGFRPSGESDRCIVKVVGRSGDVFCVIVSNGVGNVRVRRVEKS
jgi:type II secretory pathway pseudopilin PulG